MDSLSDRVAALEQRLRKAQSAPVSGGKPTLASEIDELEKRLNAMSYMDDGLDSGGVLVEENLELEPGCSRPGMGDETGDAVNFDDEIVEDELDGGIGDEAFATGPKFGSETKPGVEDRITQARLSEVEKVMHGTELTTDDSMLAVAPTKHVASEEYVARLHRASERLDKVATYLERQGRVKLAARIDKISDAIDARAKQASRRV